VTQYPASYTSEEVSIFYPTPGPNTKLPGRTYTWSQGMRFCRLATDYITLILHSSGRSSYSIQALIESSSKKGYLENVNFATLLISVKNIGGHANLASDCVALLFRSSSAAGSSRIPKKSLGFYARGSAIPIN
jgi:xylan 1,4-beta-xylosidase